MQREGLKSATSFFLVALELQRERAVVALVVAPLVALWGIKKEPFYGSKMRKSKNNLTIYFLCVKILYPFLVF